MKQGDVASDGRVFWGYRLVKRKDGTFRDIAHPLNNETRRRFEEQIIASYREELEGRGGGVRRNTMSGLLPMLIKEGGGR